MTNYKCTGCGKEGVKLWRMYMSTMPKLKCYKCACSDQGINLEEVEFLQDGTHTVKQPKTYTEEERTDQIKWYVPAVPTEERCFLGYFAIPPELYQQWADLPLAQ